MRRVRSRDEGTVLSPQDKKLRRRSLREVFAPKRTRLRLAELKLLDSASSERRDITPAHRPSNPTAAVAFSNKAEAASADAANDKAVRKHASTTLEQGQNSTTKSEAGEMQAENATSTLQFEDLQKLFAGAPQFSVEEAGIPRIWWDFPWNASPLRLCKTEDHGPFTHPAYSLSTTGAEIPEISGMNGLENGTVGLNYFMHLPLADSLQSAEPSPISGDTPNEEAKRLAFQSNPEELGFRKLDMSSVVDRLTELSDTYQKMKQSRKARSILDSQTPAELHNILFQKFLVPPHTNISARDPYSLKVQLEALIRALNVQGLWRDFSQVEWRIKLGQLLWATQDPFRDAPAPESELYPCDRDMLLFQITLACELLLRLDALDLKSDKELQSSMRLAPADLAWLRRQRETGKIKWDLILVRRFLADVQVKPSKRTEEKRTSRQIRRFFFLPETLKPPEYEEYPDIILLPRHQERQLEGLRHFSHSIGWTDTEALEYVLGEKFPPIQIKRPNMFRSTSVYLTPLANPGPRPQSQGTDYFNSRPRPQSPSRQQPIRPHLGPGQSPQRSFQLQTPMDQFITPAQSPSQLQPDVPGSARAASLELLRPQQMPTGWLTRAYLTSLILPGESLQHHLISALLENSPAAMLKLGDTATLYGGFVYAKRSYWSKCCVVGRVLGSKNGSNEGWGWIGTNVVPTVNGTWSGEGWIDVAVDEVPEPAGSLAKGGEARIKQGLVIKRDSDAFGGKDVSELRLEDFTVVTDPLKKPSSTLWFDGLRLQRQPDSTPGFKEDVEDEIPPPATCKAVLAFSSMSISSEIGSPTIPLLYDVYFISAVPCQNRTAPTRLEQTNIGVDGDSTDHALSVRQRYCIVPAGDLLKKTFKFPNEPVKGSSQDDSAEREVLVCDARGSEALGLLARAWCSWKGEHAVLGRVGVTCVACCVREARAAGVGVVIRVG